MYCNVLVYEDPYENHFGDKAFLVKYCIIYSCHDSIRASIKECQNRVAYKTHNWSALFDLNVGSSFYLSNNIWLSLYTSCTVCLLVKTLLCRCQMQPFADSLTIIFHNNLYLSIMYREKASAISKTAGKTITVRHLSPKKEGL